MPGRTSLARTLLLTVLLSCLPAAAGAGEPGRVRATRDEPAAGAPAGDPARTGEAPAFVPGRVLVRFGGAVGERSRRAAAAAIGGRVVAGNGPARMVRLPSGADVAASARRLAARPEVAFAEPDWLRRVDDCPPSVCWHLQPRPGANVVAAHGRGTAGLGRTVAVVDTGVARDPDDPTDPDDPADDFDLGDRVAARWRCTLACTRLDPAAVDTPAHPNDPADPLNCAHGTEVASVVAAADDRDGPTGVAPRAAIASYRVDAVDAGRGGGCPIAVSAVGAALRRIADDPEVDVVNLSLGGPQWSRTEQEAIGALLADGKVVVAAAGNDGAHVPRYPAAYPGVISVGATDAAGQVASFSSYGKVDVVAPGVCVAVAEVAGDRQPGCAGAAAAGVAYHSGTSYAAPIVAGLLTLAGDPGPLRARLAVEASAAATSPGGPAKAWAHGLADAAGFVAAHDPAAPPALVLETSGRAEDGGHRFGSGDGQLPHPDTTLDAYAFRAGGALAAPPQTAAAFTGAAAGEAPFQEVGGEPGVFRATLPSGPLGPGAGEVTATAPVGGAVRRGTVPVLALHADDQAPGVALVGAGDDAWRRLGGVGRDDLHDVYAVTLRAGDRLDAAVAGAPGQAVAARLFGPGTTDVFGQVDQAHVVACAGAAPGCPPAVAHTAASSGTYLLDLAAAAPTGPAAAYQLTWTVANADGPSVEAPGPACSPNDDGVRDRCLWSAGALPGWTTTSFVTRGTALARRLDGPDPRHGWDGRDHQGARLPDGGYVLRVLSTGPGGRALLRAFTLTLDTARPRISAAGAAPNPFEPRPRDGDRDTTTFALHSSEAGRVQVVITRKGTSGTVMVLRGLRAAGRQRIGWSGRSASGQWLRGQFAYVVETMDAAGNTARSGRRGLQIS
jgi:Subtilase family